MILPLELPVWYLRLLGYGSLIRVCKGETAWMD